MTVLMGGCVGVLMIVLMCCVDDMLLMCKSVDGVDVLVDVLMTALMSCVDVLSWCVQLMCC
jgi:arginine exporter protein ArgO